MAPSKPSTGQRDPSCRGRRSVLAPLSSVALPSCSFVDVSFSPRLLPIAFLGPVALGAIVACDTDWLPLELRRIIAIGVGQLERRCWFICLNLWVLSIVPLALRYCSIGLDGEDGEVGESSRPPSSSCSCIDPLDMIVPKELVLLLVKWAAIGVGQLERRCWYELWPLLGFSTLVLTLRYFFPGMGV